MTGGPGLDKGNIGISVVIPTRNRKDSVQRAILSVQSQTHSNWECIVVDDGSTDGSVEILDRLAAGDARVKVLASPSSRGAQASRNMGVRASSFEWVAFLDSDDSFLPDSLERRLGAALERRASVAHSACRTSDPSRAPDYDIPPWEGDALRETLTRPGPMLQALLCSKDLLLDIGGLDESLVAYQEWDTYIRLAGETEFAFVPEPTFIYVTDSPDAISRSAARAAEGYEQVVAKHLTQMRKVAGKRSVAIHWRNLCVMNLRARRYGRALRFFVRSVIESPRVGLRPRLRTAD